MEAEGGEVMGVEAVAPVHVHHIGAPEEGLEAEVVGEVEDVAAAAVQKDHAAGGEAPQEVVEDPEGEVQLNPGLDEPALLLGLRGLEGQYR